MILHNSSDNINILFLAHLLTSGTSQYDWLEVRNNLHKILLKIGTISFTNYTQGALAVHFINQHTSTNI